jgi:hypothetical protein
MLASEAAQNMVKVQVALAGGMNTVAGLRVAYLGGLIDSDEFAERMETLPVPSMIVHPSQLPS